jgi:hypothetical protein
LRVLETHGSDYIDRPEELKYLLAPLIARSETEQELFYTVFDTYLEEAGKWQPPVVDTPSTPVPVLSRYVWWILGALALALVGFVIFLISQNEPLPPWGILAPNKIELDSAFTIRNTGGDLDTNQYTYRWAIFDEKSNTVELQDSQLLEWQPVIRELRNGPHKFIQFRVTDNATGEEVHRSMSPLTIVCPGAQQPAIQDISFSAVEIRPDQPVRFTALLEHDDHLAYEWRIRDSVITQEKTLSHTFREVGKYQLRLILRDTSSAVICEGEKIKEINVQDEEEPLALLSLFPLKKSELEEVNYFRSWLWWFLLLPLGLCVYTWWRWWRHKKQMERAREQAKEAKIAAAVSRDQEKKQPPFLIPFSDQNQYIQRDPASQRLADALRQRREGRRKQLDLRLSLEATVAQGGFPSPRYRFDQQATEYLFLVDRQAPGSHQFDLFHFLVDELHRQEAYIETFYYDTEFYRFWNDHYTEGISLEVLQRNYPGHRLVILGDAHALLDPAGRGLPDIKANYHAALNTWKQRLLISPLPPLSWTFRERVLNKMFAVFPADVAGLEAAAHFIESDLNPEDLPASFPEWQRQLERKRQEADVNYRDWSDIAELEEHFADRDDLMTWLRALAVYPKPNWAVTVLIGRALAARGVVVSYDNLLQLARVEWLQTGSWDESLRQDLLADADAGSLRLARTAVRDELAAIQKEIAANSFAALALETNLTVLDFELDPDAKQNKDALFLLLSQNQLNSRQIAELNQHLQQHLQAEGRDAEAADIREFVAPRAEDDPATEEEPDITFTQPFWSAFAASMLFFLITLLLAAGDPAHFKQNALFVKVEMEADSAVLLNNMAVDAFTRQDVTGFGSSGGERSPTLGAWLNGEASRALPLLRRALELNPDYDLAKDNEHKVMYNLGVIAYNDILRNDGVSVDDLSSLEEVFKNVQGIDSLKLDAWHALGLINYYIDKESILSDDIFSSRKDAALLYYDSLLITRYFDTLSLYPNLETFLNLRPRIRSVQTNYRSDNALDLTIDYTSNAAEASLELVAMIVDEDRALLRGTEAIRKAIRENGAKTDILTLPPEKIRRGNAGDSILVWIYNTEEKREVVEYILPFVEPEKNAPAEQEPGIAFPALAVNQTYCIINIPSGGIAVRNRILSREEVTLMNLKSDSLAAQRLSNTTAIGSLANGSAVFLLKEHPEQFEIRFEGKNAFIVKVFRNRPTLGICPDSQPEIISTTVVISGRVADQSTGNPLANVQVNVVPENDTRQIALTQLQGTTDAQGGFTVAGLNSNTRYQLQLVKEGWGMVGSSPDVRTGTQWSEQSIEKRMLRLNPNFEVRGTLTDADTRQPIPNALVTVFGMDFSKGTNTDARGQFEVSFSDVDPNTSTLSVAVIKKGYPDRDFNISNYSSGKMLDLEITAEAGGSADEKWLVDLFQYPIGEVTIERDYLLADIMKVGELLKDRETLRDQGRLGEMLARYSLLNFAIGTELDLAVSSAAEALKELEGNKGADSPYVPLLRAMPDLVTLDKNNQEINRQMADLNAGKDGKVNLVKLLIDVIPPMLTMADNQKRSVLALDSFKNPGTDNRRANLYLTAAQLSALETWLAYANSITGIQLESRDKELRTWLDSMGNPIRDYNDLLQRYRDQLSRY